MARPRPTSSMEGFIRRPSDRKVGGVIGGQQSQPQKRPELGLSPVEPQQTTRTETARVSRTGISRDEISASLNNIHDNDTEPERKKGRKPRGQKSARRRWIVRSILAIFVVIIGIGGYFGWKTIVASGNVFKGSILDVFQNQPLKQDANGRSNILVLGTSQDDPGHQGGNLTDSMMILSIDQNKKNAYMISIPRDLYVKYGQACDSGYTGKINVYYSCVGGDGNSVDADRAALTKTENFIGNIFGLDIQYGVNVDYTVMRDLVNAVGGSITVDIQGDGPTPTGVPAGSIMDSNFDWKCGVGDRKVTHAQVLKRCPPRGHFIDYGPGNQTLDAEHALYLAQARGDSAPTWGLTQSNFDRERNQQKIIKAIRDKAVSAGVLANFGNVSNIIDTLGNNLRTTFQTNEARTLASLSKDIKDNDIKTIDLNTGDNPIMTTGMVDGQSVVEPAAGTYDYSGLQLALQQKMSSDPVIQEAAPIAVFNGSGVAGVAQTEANKLKDDKFSVGTVGNAPTGNYAQYVLYEIGSDAPGTLAKLEQRYNVKVTAGAPPVTVSSTTKFVLIIGQQPTTTSSN